tara:strand:- start:71 stop:472 length:402 start_codon:yes stop_codon:yes gene_type:complete
MSINQFALQTAIYTKLSTDSNLTTTLGASVFDDIPENTPYPYVQLGEDTAIDYSTKDQTGSEVTVNIDVWSRYRGSLQAKNIMDRVHTLLHDSSLSVTGSNFINMRFEFSDIIRDPDGITRHGVMRFRAIMLG